MASIADFKTQGWKGSEEEQELCSKAGNLVIHGNLLHEPLDAGHSYRKPFIFLSIALDISNLTLEEILAKEAKLHIEVTHANTFDTLHW